jgi:4-diphosphocytidyl-2-C-methyl-D-erythritol kinase
VIRLQQSAPARIRPQSRAVIVKNMRNVSTWSAPAKLNLMLHVLGRRADGYHELQTVFQLIDLCDRIEIAVRPDGVISRPGGPAGVAEEEDLTVRAARALKAVTGTNLGAEIRVHKRIPMGGGLGGGSSDAATTLLALNKAWDTGLDTRKIAPIGAGLGADVTRLVSGQ